MMIVKTTLLAAAAAFQVGDVLTTNHFLAMGITEGNSVVAWVQACLGDAWVVPKLIMAALVILVLSYAKTAKPAFVFAALGLLTVVYNVGVIAGP